MPELFLEYLKFASYIALVIIPTFLAYVVFFSKVTVLQSAPLNPTDPFSARFQITNGGTFAVSDVSVKVKIVGKIGLVSFNCVSQAQPEVIPILKPGINLSQWISFDLQNVGAQKGDKVTVIAKTRFIPAYACWHLLRYQKFETVRALDGSFHWTQLPVNAKSDRF